MLDAPREHPAADAARRAAPRPGAGWTHVIARLGLRERLRHRPHELSGGQQQRVAIARALLPRPDVVFADEPTGNLDSRAGAEVLGLLRSSVRETGQTVVMVTHDPRAAAYADRVVLLADGRLAGELTAPTADVGARRAARTGGLTPCAHVLFASVRAHAARLVASTLAIVIAVGFVVATLVLDETSRATAAAGRRAPRTSTPPPWSPPTGRHRRWPTTSPRSPRLPGVRRGRTRAGRRRAGRRPRPDGSRYLMVESRRRRPRRCAGSSSPPARCPSAPARSRSASGPAPRVGDVLPVTTRRRRRHATHVRRPPSPASSTSAATRRPGCTAAASPRTAAGAGLGRADAVELRVAGRRAPTPRRSPPACAPRWHGQRRHRAHRPAAGRAGRGRDADRAHRWPAPRSCWSSPRSRCSSPGWSSPTRSPCCWPSAPASWRCCAASAPPPGRCGAACWARPRSPGWPPRRVGVGAGIGLAAAVSALVGGTDSPIPLSGVSVPLYAVARAGSSSARVATLLAALAPARAATRVAPLAALRPVDPAPLRSRRGVAPARARAAAPGAGRRPAGARRGRPCEML